MNILVIGGGGREHALAWRLAQSPSKPQVFATPGNPGIASVATLLEGAGSYLDAATACGADLTVVGPEVPLVAGVVDEFRVAGRRIVGPSASAARLEGSKVFAKQFFADHRIPTAAFVAVDSREAARRALDQFALPVVIKADGLAAGKGVIIAHDRAEAEAAIDALGERLVIEEFLVGEEISFIALTDGKTIVPLTPTQDHKAVFDGDQGPNTGGMGAYCDSRLLSAAQTELVLETVMRPTVAAMNFTGFLYAGLMMTAAGPKVLEFNVRLGDPETQPLMHRLRGDFAETLLASAEGRLADAPLEWAGGASVCVVMASGGYPGEFRKGLPITGIEAAEAEGATVFHAGTRAGTAGVETNGGRVLGVTATAGSLRDAIDVAYRAAGKVRFEGMHYRRDIGAKGLRLDGSTGQRSGDKIAPNQATVFVR